MTAAEAARALLEFYGGDEKRWTQGVRARTCTGFPVSVHSEHACCWCLMGAAALLNVAQPWPGYSRWNDVPGRTFAEVVAKLEKVANG